jgi:hypothetical protein
VSDELLSRFRDKIRSRPAPGAREPNAPASAAEDETPADSIRIRDLQVGPFPAAARLHPGFLPGLSRVRLTLDLGADLRRRTGPLTAAEREQLLALCPRLLDHDCGGGSEIHLMLSIDHEPVDREAGDAAGGEPGEEGRADRPGGDGLALAHLIEHVAIDLIVATSGARRCSGVTCAYSGRLDRFDIFLECADPLLGRAAAILATAIVRDLCAGAGRLAPHRRSRDLLVSLTSGGRRSLAPEDVAASLEWSLDEAIETLGGLARLGYLETISAPFTFSSSTGLLFRRAASPESHPS